MKPIFTIALALIVGAAVPLSAQWPKFSTPGPKAADGKIDLRGPTPRTADGKPDLSGVWETIQGGASRPWPCAGCRRRYW